MINEQAFTTLLDNIKDELNDQGKAKFNAWMNESAIPKIKEAGADISAKLNEQSKSETGWCAIRDGVVYPVLISVATWVLEVTFEQIAKLDKVEKIN